MLKTTNIQKPPLYKHVLPRVLETKTNNCDINTTINLSKSPPPLQKQSATRHTPFVYDPPLSNIVSERQSRVDRILEKYRRQPSSSVSRQFSRSFSCNAATDSTMSTEPNPLLHTAKTVASIEENKPSTSGPRSVSPYALFDHSDCTFTGRRENKTNVTAVADSQLSKSYSLKSLGDYRNRMSSIDYESTSKLTNGVSTNSNDEDPLSWSSSSSIATTATNSKSAVPREDANHCFPTVVDWKIGNCNEETMSDRIRRRSYYVKLK